MTTGMSQGAPRVGVWLLKMAAIYLVIGLGLGIGMSVAHRFQLSPVHAHLNLLGWASLGLTGIVYCLFPKAGESRLGLWHFWLHNLGLPVMMAGLTLYLTGRPQFEPVVAIGSIITVSGLALFVANLFLNVRTGAQAASEAAASRTHKLRTAQGA